MLAARARYSWWPTPTFEFRDWLAGLIVFTCLLLLVSPLFFRNGRPIRPFAWFFAALMIVNGVAHTLGTIVGHTFPTVRFARPMPGFWSSPILVAASLWVLVELRRTRLGQPH